MPELGSPKRSEALTGQTSDHEGFARAGEASPLNSDTRHRWERSADPFPCTAACRSCSGHSLSF